MRIAFTGHRNMVTYHAALQNIHKEHPDAVWVHGGAIGFDSQVEKFAHDNLIFTVIHKPDYEKYGKKAPLVRNKLIVAGADLLVACWDGREGGGTNFTIKLAKERGIPVQVVPALRINNE